MSCEHDDLAACLRFVTDRECQVEELPWGPHEWLARPGLVDALLDAVARGTVGVAAYSGDNDAAGLAMDSGKFAVLQTSLNLCDQSSLHLIAACSAGGTAVLVKRPLAGRPWLPRSAASDPAHREYRWRFERLRDALGELDSL